MCRSSSFQTPPHLHDLLSADVSQPAQDVHDPFWMSLPLEQSQQVHWKTTAESNTEEIRAAKAAFTWTLISY